MAFIRKLKNANGRGVGAYRYQVRFRNPDGKLQSKTFSTEAEAYKILADIKQGQMPQPVGSHTVGQLAKRFLQNEMEGLKRTTEAFYSKLMRKHLLPRFGSKKVAALKVKDVETLKRELLEIRSASTVRSVMVCLSRILTYGQKIGWVEKNVAKLVRKPTPEKRNVRPLERGERDRLIMATSPAYRPLFALALATGARQGELLGLRWADVDFDRQTMHIRQQYTDGRLTEPKTKASVREIALPAKSVNELKAWRAVSPRSELVFPNAEGRPQNPSNLINRGFKPAVRKAGLSTDTRFHDLRHTFASALLAHGVPVTDVSKALGHSSISVTVDVYGHLMEQSHDRIRAAQAKMTETMPEAVGEPLRLVSDSDGL